MKKLDPINQAIKDFGLKVSSVNTVPDSHSSDVRILELQGGEEVVLKLLWNRTKFQREVSALNALARFNFIPRLLEVRDGERPAILMSRLPGKPLPLGPPCTPDMARQMGEALAKIQLVRLDKDEGPWWPFLTENFMKALALCRLVESNRHWDRAEKSFLKWIQNLPSPGPLRFAHFDHRPGNILSLDGRLTGIIDFESSRNGATDFDLAEMMRRGFGKFPSLIGGLLEGYRRHRKLPACFPASLPAYHLGACVANMAFCQKRGRGRGDSFYERNLSMMLAILKEIGPARRQGHARGLPGRISLLSY